MTLHVILIGVGGTICNKFTITPLISLGLTKQNAESLASQLRDHAIQRLSTITNTRHALCFQGASRRGGFAGRAATAEDGRRRVRALRGMAVNPPDPHLFCFCLSPRLVLSSLGGGPLGEASYFC